MADAGHEIKPHMEIYVEDAGEIKPADEEMDVEDPDEIMPPEKRDVGDADENKPQEEVEIEIDVDALVKSIEEKCASTQWQPSTTVTIFRVPEDIRKHDRDAYTPKFVSIGPFHRPRPNLPSQHLQAMENHKRHYVKKVLSRSAPENDLKKYIEEMKKLEPDARACYSEIIEMRSDEFVEMLLFDGCFIVQLLLQAIPNGDFERSELIYSNKWMLPCIGHDLLLLENQIPYFVLKRLWALAGQSTYDLCHSVLDFFRNLLPDKPAGCPLPRHLLHLMHSSFRPGKPITSSFGPGKPRTSFFRPGKPRNFSIPLAACLPHDMPLDMSFPVNSERPRNPQDSQMPPPPKTIPTATELQEAGIKFQRREAFSFMEVTYNQGLMAMPPITVSDNTNSLFRNFIAFEHCFPDCYLDFTSYCIFMDSLINTPRDVQLLSQSGILEHVLGSDKEVALLFNKLCRGVTWDFKNSYLKKIFEEVNQHTQKRWPKWRAKLVRDYFSNPWAVLSLVAAIIILMLTFLQTYFGIFGYFRPP